MQAASNVGAVLGGLYAYRWSRTNQRARVLTQAAGLALAAPFLAVIGLTASLGLPIVALQAFGLGRSFFDANTMPVLNRIVAPELRATGCGILNLAGCVIGGVAAGTGWLKSVIGSPPPLRSRRS